MLTFCIQSIGNYSNVSNVRTSVVKRLANTRSSLIHKYTLNKTVQKKSCCKNYLNYCREHSIQVEFITRESNTVEERKICYFYQPQTFFLHLSFIFFVSSSYSIEQLGKIYKLPSFSVK